MQVHEQCVTSAPVLTPKGAEGGRIFFLPLDLGLFSRISETRSDFLEMLSSLPEAAIRPDGTGADPASEAIISEAEQQFTELLNYVCGLETAPEAFRQYRPFASVGGRFWACAVMDVFGEAQKVVTKNIEQIQKKMNTNGGKRSWKKRK